MTITLQNLRAIGTGVEPTSLLPGQLAFNVTDKVIYVGDGSSAKTNFDGSSTPGVAGAGWYAMPMDFAALNEYYVANPEFYGDVPTDQQVLTWSTDLNHPIWTSGGGGGGGGNVYVTTNSAVALAPGATTSAKISAAIGVVSPDEGDVTIVTGLPDDVYEGLYFFTTSWVKGAAYAYPSASEVIYNNTAHPTLPPTVQGAIDNLDAGLTATTAIANTANSTANSALSIASAALPKAGGTMTGALVSRNVNVQSGYGVQFDGGTNGTINGITDSISSASSTVAASGVAVKTSYDLAAAALSRSGGTMTGAITFVAGQVFPVSGIQDATAAQKGVVQIGTNVDVASGVISVKTADTANLGVVQVGTNIDVASGTISVKTADTSNLGLVEVGTNIDVASGVISVKTADTSNLGLVEVGTNIDVAGGVISVKTADTSNLGLVEVGTNIDVTGGVISVKTADTSNLGLVIVGTNIDVTSGTISVKTGSASDFGILKVGTNLDVTGGVVSVKSATTTQAGIVQLNNTTASSSTTQALTAAQGLNLQTQINSLTVASNTKLAGSINCATGLVNSVTTDGIAKGFVVGSLPPAPAPGNANYYMIVTVGSASYTPPGGGGPYAPENGDWFLSSGTLWQYLGVGARPSYASTTTAGIVQLSDDATTQAGSNATLAVTPASLQSKISDSTSTTSSIAIASSTAVKSAYDLANAALPKSGGTMTGGINLAASGVTFSNASQVTAISDGIATTSSVTAASSTAVKSAYDIGNAALPKSGGTMTGDITMSGSGIGVVFNDASTVEAISDSTSITSSVTAASATAVKSAYDLANTANNTANAALPKAGGTMTGGINLAAAGVTFSDASAVLAISDSTSTTSSTTASSATAVKSAYDLANSALQRAGGTMTGAITFVAGQTFPVSGIQDATTGQKGVVQIGTNINVTSGTISVPAATTGSQGAVQIGTNINVTSGTISVPAATAATQGAVQVGSNIQVASGTISVQNSSTAQTGVVQLNDTVASTSTTQALTANQGYQLQQQINALSTSNNVTFAGTFNAATSLMVTVTNEGAAVGFTVGSGLPAASATVAEYFVIVSTAGTTTPPGGSPTVANVGDWFLASASSWTYIAAGYLPPAASTTTAGIVQLATNAQTQTGTNSTNAVVPSGLQSKMSDSTSTTSSTTIASSTAVKAAYDLANAAVPKSCYTALGALAAGTGAGTVGTLAIGTTGQFLAANTGCSTGLQWCTLSLACIPCSAFTAAGQLLAGTGTSTFTALSVGTNGQLLVADSTCTGGLKWLTSQGINLCGYTCTATPFNTAIGCGAGGAVTSSANSTYIGNNAGKSVTSGSSNTALGTNSACSVSTGARNTGVGHNAIIVIGTGSDNTAVGAFSGQALSTGSSCNTVVGSCALYTNSTGGSNVAIGAGASQNGASGSNNVAVGTQAMQVNTSTGSVAVGFQAMLNNTAGVNVAIGSSALRANTTGTGNTAIGINAGISVTGPNQTIVGYNAGCNITTGDSNSLVGFGAGLGITTGTCNTVLGFCALTAAGVVNQTNNVAIGAFAGAAVTLGANTLVGFCSGASLTGTPANTFIGCGAGRLATTGQANTAIGCGAIGSGVTTGSNNFAGGVLAGDGLTSGSTNTFLGYTSGRLVTTGGQNTIIGAYGGTTTLANNVVLSDGAGTIRFQSNSSGAISLGTGGSYGTAGQILVSGGSGAAPTWTSSGTATANYGSFVRTTTQTNTGGASGNAVSYDTTSSANNFSIVSGSRITAAVAGTYQILASLQVQKTDAGTDDINFWIKKNGVNEPNSAYNLTLQGSGAAQLGYINWVVTLAAGGYVELWWYSADVNARLLTDPAVAPYPDVPASGFIIHPMGA